MDKLEKLQAILEQRLPKNPTGVECSVEVETVLGKMWSRLIFSKNVSFVYHFGWLIFKKHFLL